MRTYRADLRRLRLGLAGLVGTLVTLHLVIVVALRSTRDLFDLNSEANVPTWVSAAMLATVAVGFFLLSDVDAPVRRRGWQGAAVVAGLMSLDEVARLHERLADLIDTGRTDGMQVFAWVVPGSVIVLAIAAGLVRHVRTLPRPLALRLLVGVGLFFLGALGMELVGAAETDVALRTETFDVVESSRLYLATTGVEECLELMGESVLVLAVVGEYQRLVARSAARGSAAAGSALAVDAVAGASAGAPSLAATVEAASVSDDLGAGAGAASHPDAARSAER